MGEVATKKDLSQVRTEIQMEIALLRSEMIQMEERLTMKIDLAIAKAISNQNKWMIGFMFSLVVPLSIALLR